MRAGHLKLAGLCLRALTRRRRHHGWRLYVGRGAMPDPIAARIRIVRLPVAAPTPIGPPPPCASTDPATSDCHLPTAIQKKHIF